MQNILKFFSPLRAVRDLRVFLAHRKRHELLLLFPALALTMLILVAFYVDSIMPVEYKPNIIYVQSWPLDRSDAEIVAQQKIDQIQKRKDQAEADAKRKELQRQFKKVDDWLTKHGI